MKAQAFEPFLDLPRRAGKIFELVLTTNSELRRMLKSRGWRLPEPMRTIGSPWSYRRFIQHSRGEFSVAKHGYVVSKSGWFSERSAAYLATGRPTVIQDTGFGEWLPTGKGVVAFKTPEEALEGLQSVSHDYEAHCLAARELAEAYFDSGTVLSSLLDRVLDGRTSRAAPTRTGSPIGSTAKT
jgi:hypothetical protein